ncbi:MAG TPA: CGNR zinc finger domain-containing protein [Actinomycetota bacterium]
MDERDKRRVGEQVEPGGRPKAPGRLELLQRFVNTWNHEFPREWDRLGTAAKARRWLLAKRLVSDDARIDEGDAERLRTLREAIRALAIAHHGTPPPPEALAVLRREGASSALAVTFERDGEARLEPASDGADAAVATLLGILHESQLTGSWPRLKACRRCAYAFYDRSKNRSAAWCAMSICGNRTKNRAYRRRRAATTSTRRSSRGTPGGRR